MFKASAKVDAKKEFDMKPQFGKAAPKEGVKRAFDEMKKNPPRILAKTKKKFGAEKAGKQKVAIAMSKARKGY